MRNIASHGTATCTGRGAGPGRGEEPVKVPVTRSGHSMQHLNNYERCGGGGGGGGGEGRGRAREGEARVHVLEGSEVAVRSVVRWAKDIGIKMKGYEDEVWCCNWE